MGNNPYRDGERSYHNCYSRNPYTREPAAAEWKAGYDAAEMADLAARQAQSDRWNSLWNVPERARDEYIRMEDDFCASTVLDFMLAMHPEPDE